MPAELHSLLGVSSCPARLPARKGSVDRCLLIHAIQTFSFKELGGAGIPQISWDIVGLLISTYWLADNISFTWFLKITSCTPLVCVKVRKPNELSSILLWTLHKEGSKDLLMWWLDYPHLCFHKYSFGFPYYSTVCVAIPVLRNSKVSSWNLLLGCFHGSFKTIFKRQLPTEGVFKVTPPCVLTRWSTYLFFFFLVSFSIDVFKSDICWLTPPSWSIVY